VEGRPDISRVKTSSDATGHDVGTGASHGASSRGNRQLKILIADDDGTSRTVLKSLLKQHFAALVTEAEDGSRALDVIDKGGVDVMFLDLRMPVMDGLEVLEALRADPAHRSLPVVVLSALSDQSTVQRAISLGISDYLVKPLRPLLMDGRILNLLTAIERRPTGAQRPSAVRPSRSAVGGRRVLLVDADVNFAAFFVGLFEEDYEIAHVDNGREAARVLAEWQPEIVVIGSGLRLPSAPDLSRKIRRQRKSVKLFLCADGPEPEGEDAKVYDGLLPKTFIPDSFRKTFSRIVASEPTARPAALGPLDDQLREDVVTSTRQTLGVTTMQEARVLPADALASFVGEVWSTVELRGGPDLPCVCVGLAATRADVEKLAERMVGAPMTIDDGAGDAFGELINTVGGRVLAGLESRGLPLKIGLPTIAVESAPADAGRWKIVVPFETEGGERLVVCVGLASATAVETAVPADTAAAEPASTAADAPA